MRSHIVSFFVDISDLLARYLRTLSICGVLGSGGFGVAFLSIDSKRQGGTNVASFRRKALPEDVLQLRLQPLFLEAILEVTVLQ